MEAGRAYRHVGQKRAVGRGDRGPDLLGAVEEADFDAA
jgi:hypothetical protein